VPPRDFLTVENMVLSMTNGDGSPIRRLTQMSQKAKSVKLPITNKPLTINRQMERLKEMLQ
jgi:hypothetical protein